MVMLLHNSIWGYSDPALPSLHMQTHTTMEGSETERPPASDGEQQSNGAICLKEKQISHKLKSL